MLATLRSIEDYAYSATWEAVRAEYFSRLGDHRMAEYCRELAQASERRLAQLQRQGGQG